MTHQIPQLVGIFIISYVLFFFCMKMLPISTHDDKQLDASVYFFWSVLFAFGVMSLFVK